MSLADTQRLFTIHHSPFTNDGQSRHSQRAAEAGARPGERGGRGAGRVPGDAVYGAGARAVERPGAAVAEPEGRDRLYARRGLDAVDEHGRQPFGEVRRGVVEGG